MINPSSTLIDYPYLLSSIFSLLFFNFLFQFNSFQTSSISFSVFSALWNRTLIIQRIQDLPFSVHSLFDIDSHR